MTRRGYPKHVRDKAAELREAGLSRARIARELDIGLSTVARWFREDGVTRPEGLSRMEAWRISNRRTLEERWAHQQAEQDRHRDAVGELSERELFLVGVALYWAEGGKSKPWRREHRVILINSDPAVIRTFLAWLDLMAVPRSTLHCRVHIHESADIASAERWWRELVGAEAHFARPIVKRHVVRTVRHNVGDTYRGCLMITVQQSASLYRRIAGTWEGIACGVGSAEVMRSPVV